MRPVVYAVATMDTKGEELAYVAQIIANAEVAVRMVDVGTKTPPITAPDVTREDVASRHPRGARHVLQLPDRGQAVSAMSEALTYFLITEHRSGAIAGVIGLGGSGGTSLLAPGFRALPIGLPKLIVSTVASGQTSTYLGSSDIILMPSVVDIAGINQVSSRILANAAHAMAGMVRAAAQTERIVSPRPTVGMTMFGVTTPCVTVVRKALEATGHDCLVFHATGTGGQAMEKLVDSGLINGVIDVTTTEVADEVVGGVFPAGPARFDAILAREIPYVLSLGALDMVNFGPLDSVPPQFKDRHLHVHNAQVTLMRTTPEENRQVARWIANKLNRATAPWTLLIPEGGVSLLDAPGQPFYDPDADHALFEELEKSILPGPTRQLRRMPCHINDDDFAHALVSAYAALNGILSERRT